ncbi:hypothetical protein D041_3872A, partial [Vibrio parahaemolyticus EKP-008]
MLDFYIDL